MSFFLLMVAFVLTGTTNITNKALHQWGLDAYRDVYMLALYASAMALGLGYLLLKGERQPWPDRRLGLFMGFNGAVSMVFFLIAIQHLQGIVVFPVRSLGNLVMTAIFSIIAWKEQLSRSQRIGIALSLLAIWLIY